MGEGTEMGNGQDDTLSCCDRSSAVRYLLGTGDLRSRLFMKNPEESGRIRDSVSNHHLYTIEDVRATIHNKAGQIQKLALKNPFHEGQSEIFVDHKQPVLHFRSSFRH
eukprot:scaffold119_cov245-Chaetoceros_neogracile.AAC.11